MNEHRHAANAVTVVRTAVGLVLSSHGFSKLFLGFREPLGGVLAEWGFPLPEALAWWVTLIELAGGAALAFGFLVTPLAVYFIAHLALGILKVHAPHGWYTVGPGQNGVEFSVLLIACLGALLVDRGVGFRSRGSRLLFPSPKR